MRDLAIQTLGLSVVLGIVAVAEAAPLELKHVSANAAWLGHVDFDAMRESTVVQKAMEKHTHAGHMAMVKKMIGMDPEKDLHGMTFYGSEIGKHTGVMILHARVDQRRLMGMARMVSPPQVSDHGKHRLHSWTHKSRHSDKTHTAAVAFYGEGTIVMASSVDQLKLAVDVLDGKSKSLTNDSSLSGNIPAGTTMLMRAEGISRADLPDKLKVAEQTESFRFVTGEHNGESFYRARAEMTNEDIAGHGKEIIEGLKALGYIHVGNNETGKKLVDGLRIKTSGTTLTILWSAPADDVWAIIDAHRKIFAERTKQHSHRHGWGGHQDWRRRWGQGHGDWGRKSSPEKSKVPSEEDF